MAWIYEIGVGKYFNQSQQENNATEFYNYFINYGASIEAICGMLGNITRESTLNPANKQGNSTKLGWGLIQWTPATVLINWCEKYGYNWYDGTVQCERIKCEGEGTKGANGCWLPTSDYSYSWSEFIALTDVTEATKAYLYERERAGVEALDLRLQYANEWYSYFTGSPVPPIPPTPLKLKRKMPIYMMLRKNY
jgi:hypothetical protein